jgi:hypothetical protein
LQSKLQVLQIMMERQLTARELACLQASSHTLKQVCSSGIRSALLLRSVTAACTATDGSKTASAALLWLLQQPAMTAASINAVSMQLLAIPCVPLAAAEALVRAGLRTQLTSDQLVTAAVAGAASCHVWLAAYVSIGVPRDKWAAALSTAMEDACLGCLLTKQVRSWIGIIRNLPARHATCRQTTAFPTGLG